MPSANRPFGGLLGMISVVLYMYSKLTIEDRSCCNMSVIAFSHAVRQALMARLRYIDRYGCFDSDDYCMDFPPESLQLSDYYDGYGLYEIQSRMNDRMNLARLSHTKRQEIWFWLGSLSEDEKVTINVPVNIVVKRGGGIDVYHVEYELSRDGLMERLCYEFNIGLEKE